LSIVCENIKIHYEVARHNLPTMDVIIVSRVQTSGHVMMV